MSELLKKRARDNIGALGFDDLPTKVSELLNDLGYLTTASNLVQSVNGQVGAVVLSTSHVSEGSNLYYTDIRVADSPSVSDNTTAINDGRFELTNRKGTADGYAPLDFDSFVPLVNLPEGVKNVSEYADFASLPGTGLSEKFYITLDDGAIYRWNGSAYIPTDGTLTAGGIKTLYESNADTNAFTDVYKQKLDYITVTQDVNLDDIELATTTNAGNISANFVAISNIVSFTDAPSDGSEYTRKDGAWFATAGGGGSATFDDLTDTDFTALANYLT